MQPQECQMGWSWPRCPAPEASLHPAAPHGGRRGASACCSLMLCTARPPHRPPGGHVVTMPVGCGSHGGFLNTHRLPPPDRATRPWGLRDPSAACFLVPVISVSHSCPQTRGPARGAVGSPLRRARGRCSTVSRLSSTKPPLAAQHRAQLGTGWRGQVSVPRAQHSRGQLGHRTRGSA